MRRRAERCRKDADWRRYGHMHRAGAPEEDALCALATAGAVPRAPCYEAYGRSRVKLLHFMPLHATESALGH